MVEAITLNKIKIKTNGHTFTLERNKSLSGLAKNNSNLDLSILLPEYFDTASKKDELSDTEDTTKESSSSEPPSSSKKEDSPKEKKENNKDKENNKKESKKEDYEL